MTQENEKRFAVVEGKRKPLGISPENYHHFEKGYNQACDDFLERL
jgi:hypothetical protein